MTATVPMSDAVGSGGLHPGMFRAARQGEFAVTDPALESVIGHPPRSARSVLETILSGT